MRHWIMALVFGLMITPLSATFATAQATGPIGECVNAIVENSGPNYTLNFDGASQACLVHFLELKDRNDHRPAWQRAIALTNDAYEQGHPYFAAHRLAMAGQNGCPTPAQGVGLTNWTVNVYGENGERISQGDNPCET